MKSKEKSEYFLKLINKGFKKEKVRLLVDIWPYEFRSHPERHYFYSAIDIDMQPRSSVEFKIFYDWESEMVFLIDGKEARSVDWWRGNMKNAEMYLMYVNVSDSQDKTIDEAKFLQRMKE